MRRSTTRSKIKKNFMRLAAALFWLLLWQIAAWLIAKPLLLAGPIEIAGVLVRFFQTAAFWQVLLATFLRIAFGYTAGVLLGALLGMAAAKSALLQSFLRPVLEFLKAAPITSFILLAIIWLGKESVAVFACIVMVAPMVAANVEEGIGEVSPQHLEMARAYRLPLAERMKKIYVPAVAPYFFPAASTAMGFAWKAGVAAEVLAVPKQAVGTEMFHARQYLETADLLAYTVLVVALSMLLDRLVKHLLTRAQRRLTGGFSGQSVKGEGQNG